MGLPRVRAPASLATDLGEPRPVDDDEGQAEALLHLVAPLLDHRGRTGHHHPAHALAHQHLAEDQPGLDGLAQADVVGDEQPHPRHLQGLAQGLELVVLDLDARPVGRLEEPGIGRGDAVPAQGVEVGREQIRAIEAPLGHRLPAALAEDPRVELALPQHLEGLAEGVVLEAGQADQGGVAVSVRGREILDEVLARADADDLSRLERVGVAPAMAGGWGWSWGLHGRGRRVVAGLRLGGGARGQQGRGVLGLVGRGGEIVDPAQLGELPGVEPADEALEADGALGHDRVDELLGLGRGREIELEVLAQAMEPLATELLEDAALAEHRGGWR